MSNSSKSNVEGLFWGAEILLKIKVSEIGQAGNSTLKTVFQQFSGGTI